MSSIVTKRIIEYSCLSMAEEDKATFAELEAVLLRLSLSKQEVIAILQMVSEKAKEAKQRQTKKSHQILNHKFVKRILRGWVCRFRYKKMRNARRKLQVNLKEFMESEYVYLKRMSYLQSMKEDIERSSGSSANKRASMMLKSKLLSSEETALLFDQPLVLLKVHSELSSKLYLNSQASKQLKGLFSFLTSLTELQRYYLPFVKQYSRIVDCYHILSQKKKYKEVFTRMEKEISEGMTLDSIYAAILGRIGEYALAVEEIVKNVQEEEDYKVLAQIKQKLRKFQSELLVQREQQESYDKALQVHQRLQNLPYGDVIPLSRQFIYEGNVLATWDEKSKASHKVPIQFDLFNDIAILSTQKSADYLLSFPVNKMLYKSAPNSLAGENVIELYPYQEEAQQPAPGADLVPIPKKIQIFCVKLEDKEKWLENLDIATRHFRLFGVPLDVLCKREQARRPSFLKDTVHYLLNTKNIREEGLFRISAQRSHLEKYAAEYDQGLNVDLTKIDDPHVISGLLKQWLKSLPGPLFLGNKDEMDMYNSWIALTNESPEKQVEKARELTQKHMSIPSRRVARKLLKMLLLISKQEHHNKMGVSNLAIVFAPITLHPRDEKFQLSLARSTSLMDNLKSIIELMIKNYNEVFPSISEEDERAELIRAKEFIPIVQKPTTSAPSSPSPASSSSSHPTPPTVTITQTEKEKKRTLSQRLSKSLGKSPA